MTKIPSDPQHLGDLESKIDRIYKELLPSKAFLEMKYWLLSTESKLNRCDTEEEREALREAFSKEAGERVSRIEKDLQKAKEMGEKKKQESNRSFIQGYTTPPPKIASGFDFPLPFPVKGEEKKVVKKKVSTKKPKPISDEVFGLMKEKGFFIDTYKKEESPPQSRAQQKPRIQPLPQTKGVVNEDMKLPDAVEKRTSLSKEAPKRAVPKPQDEKKVLKGKEKIKGSSGYYKDKEKRIQEEIKKSSQKGSTDVKL
ncbi:MAG: hypothetical protein HRT90_07795 [Candidatus Margulisbacteria bacterium]|nr:hypothetical protein [Candidatus Margulisiibacteriota bacterium]